MEEIQPPPHSKEAEEYLLSMIFQRDEDLAEAIDLGLRPKHFYTSTNGVLFDEAVQVFSGGSGIVVEEFISGMQKAGKLDSIGGLSQFLEVTRNVISSRSVKYWVDEIIDRYHRRQLVELSENAANCAGNLDLTPHSIAAGLSNRALDVINEHEKPITLLSAADEALALVDRIVSGEATQDELGVPTPIDAINRFLGMPRPGELITIAARPGGGKSTMMRALIRHIAENSGRALYCSREMPMKELVTVFAQERSCVSWRHVRGGDALPNHITKFKKGIEDIGKMGKNLIINDRDRTVDQLIARIAANARNDDPLKAVAVDYLQRYDAQQRREETRDVAIGRFTMALKDSAITNNLTVFLGAQIGRGSERENRAPRLSDLRESGNIEQDSDRVWFLWIPDKTPEGGHQDPNDQDAPVVYVQLLQAKGRGDGLGMINLAFHRRITTFTEWKDYTKNSAMSLT